MVPPGSIPRLDKVVVVVTGMVPVPLAGCTLVEALDDDDEAVPLVELELAGVIPSTL